MKRIIIFVPKTQLKLINYGVRNYFCKKKVLEKILELFSFKKRLGWKLII
jgi:hypothetical protein